MQREDGRDTARRCPDAAARRPYLFRRGERPVEPRFATVGGVSMDDPAFRSFIDRGNGRSDLLCAGFFLVILAYPANQLLLLQKRSVLIMWIDLGGFLVGIGLNILLVPQYSYYGSAIATIAGFGLIAALKHWFSHIWSCIRLTELFSVDRELMLVNTYVINRFKLRPVDSK